MDSDRGGDVISAFILLGLFSSTWLDDSISMRSVLEWLPLLLFRETRDDDEDNLLRRSIKSRIAKTNNEMENSSNDHQR